MGTCLMNLPLSRAIDSVDTHVSSSVDVGSEPHGFILGRGPPHFTGYAGWVSCDAGLAGVHVAVDFNGIFHTALVWIHPVLP